MAGGGCGAVSRLPHLSTRPQQKRQHQALPRQHRALRRAQARLMNLCLEREWLCANRVTVQPSPQLIPLARLPGLARRRRRPRRRPQHPLLPQRPRTRRLLGNANRTSCVERAKSVQLIARRWYPVSTLCSWGTNLPLSAEDGPPSPVPRLDGRAQPASAGQHLGSTLRLSRQTGPAPDEEDRQVEQVQL
eukprot:COSAG04_NODE_297_length_17610_cov_6.873451_7_plen_190_part_00